MYVGNCNHLDISFIRLCTHNIREDTLASYLGLPQLFSLAVLLMQANGGGGGGEAGCEAMV